MKAEFTRHGLRSRIGQHRTDLKHHPLDPVIVAGPWLAAAGAVHAGARNVAKSLAHAGSDGQRPVH